jgi:hypothetical protein
MIKLQKSIDDDALDESTEKRDPIRKPLDTVKLAKATRKILKAHKITQILFAREVGGWHF